MIDSHLFLYSHIVWCYVNREMDSPGTSKTDPLIKKKIRKGGKKGDKKGKLFQDSWLKITEFKNWLTSHSDGTKAYCTACNKVLACGKSELYRHVSRDRHINNINNRDNPSILSSTVAHNIKTDHINEVKAAEIRLARNIFLQNIM